MKRPLAFALTLCAATLALAGASRSQAPAKRAVGWLSWRGPGQDGVSPEKGLPEKWTPGGENHLWTLDFGGGGTPVIANGRLYALGYAGEGPDLQEILLCADANTGKKIWEKRFSDYLSDITYNRYAIGSPTVDAETGNVYALTSAGVFSCFTPEGKLVWQHALMEQLGRLTFTNGRTGSPFVDGDLVYFRFLTSNWGGEGPASDRIYAFDKKTGGLVWSSTPGVQPKDASFARPVFAWRGGKRIMYTGTGCGHIVSLDARTGQPLWRFPLSAGGLNSSVVLYKNSVIGLHADENLDTADIGRMVAVRLDAQPKPAEPGTPGAPLLDASAELWRNRLEAISSSPVLVGNRLYQTDKTGHLVMVDPDTGKIVWEHKMAPDQLHASPTYGDGKLYIPFQNGLFFIVRPTPTGAQELSKAQLAGRCIGAPAIWNGRVYVLSTEKLYCFGSKTGGKPVVTPEPAWPKAGKPVALQVIPAEVALHPGEKAKFTIRGIDANGLVTGTYPAARAKWVKYIPPTARVRSEMNGSFNPQGELVADPQPVASAGAFQADIDGVKGTIRGRVLPAVPFTEDFERYPIDVEHATEPGTKFAYPPLPWIGARFKFEVRELDGNKVLAKTLDNIFFQRATVFVGTAEQKNYTLEADVMADGNRRTQSSVGLVNQRYFAILNGNSQELEIVSNQERIKVAVPFKWAAKQWYRLKTRVDVAADGSGVVRAKAWKKGDPEPDKWTLEVPHKNAHTNGSPGLFGFAPQSLFRVYVDNIKATAN
jgi:outer membrane protein assembly factor BamB